MYHVRSATTFSLREKRLVFEMNQNTSPETTPVVPESQEKAEHVSNQKDAAQAEGKRVDQADAAVRSAEAKANRPVAGATNTLKSEPSTPAADKPSDGMEGFLRKPLTILPQGIENTLIDVRVPAVLQSLEGKMKQMLKNPSALLSSAGGYSKYGQPENYPGGQSMEGFTAWLKDKGHPEAAEAEALSAALTPDERDVLNFIIAHPDSIPNVAVEKPVLKQFNPAAVEEAIGAPGLEAFVESTLTGNEKPEISVEQQRQFADDLLGIIRNMSAQLGPDAPIIPVTWDQVITDPATKDYFLTSIKALQNDTGTTIAVPGGTQTGAARGPEKEAPLPKDREAVAKQFIENAKTVMPDGVTVKAGEGAQVIVEQSGLSMTIIPQSNGDWVAVTEPGKAVTIVESQFATYEGNVNLGQEQMLQMIGRGLKKAREEKLIPEKS